MYIEHSSYILVFVSSHDHIFCITGLLHPVISVTSVTSVTGRADTLGWPPIGCRRHVGPF